MDNTEVVTRLLQILKRLCEQVGEQIDQLDENTVPLEEIACFDSLIGLEVIVELQEGCGLAIPDDKNIFATKGESLSVLEASKKALSYGVASQ